MVTHLTSLSESFYNLQCLVLLSEFWNSMEFLEFQEFLEFRTDVTDTFSSLFRIKIN
jgi:hypothetical protein